LQQPVHRNKSKVLSRQQNTNHTIREGSTEPNIYGPAVAKWDAAAADLNKGSKGRRDIDTISIPKAGPDHNSCIPK
jgi:hypothetical protein